MLFSARQLQEKCIEQQVSLFQVFVDLTKAFDTVNRDALWLILRKLGCPPNFVRVVKELHRDMKARLCFNGNYLIQFLLKTVLNRVIYWHLLSFQFSLQ